MANNQQSQHIMTTKQSCASNTNEKCPIKMMLDNVKVNIGLAAEKRAPDLANLDYYPRLVAVSKTKPVSDIIKAYDAGQRNFGENYVQELAEKANNEELKAACPDIKWHFIGHLQRNKIPKLMTVRPNLFMIETVDSVRLAESLNEAVLKSGQGLLRIMLQVNISGELSKSGMTPDEGIELGKKILRRDYIGLYMAGFMTIGDYERSASSEPNIDFTNMRNLRNSYCEEIERELTVCEISMGMSGDYEDAIIQGSTSVRVGSAIFGHRPTKLETKTETVLETMA